MKGNGSGALGVPGAGTPAAGTAGEGQVDYAAEIAARDALIAEVEEKAQELDARIKELGDQVAGRDLRIEELESALADSADALVAANAANEALASENGTLRAQSEVDQVNYALALAGCRNVKAARAVLEDHGGDIVDWLHLFGHFSEGHSVPHETVQYSVANPILLTNFWSRISTAVPSVEFYLTKHKEPRALDRVRRRA